MLAVDSNVSINENVEENALDQVVQAASYIPSMPASSEYRLTISKMALINFKSYAGRQEIGPFHKSFSSIVGPNGSGKSNVIDALLFVFGYRAKKMRQGKLSELIHNSKNYPDLPSCTVEIYFEEVRDLDNRIFEIKRDSQIIVSRTAYTNNSSKYTINGKNSTFTEVTDLLKGKGIDLDHNRFLILQGEVESIALMKPKAANEHDEGLLEYLEDIIGTSVYKTSIEEASKVVESMNEEKDAKVVRLRVVEREKDALEDKRQEAEAYLKQENDLVRKKFLLYQIMSCDTSINIRDLQEKINDLKTKLESERTKYAKQIEDNKKLENDYNLGVKEYEILEARANEVMKEMSKFEREDIQLQERKKHLKTKLKKLSKSQGTDKQEMNVKQNSMADMEAELKSNEEEIKQLEDSLTKEDDVLLQIREGLKGKIEKFQVQIESHQEKLAPWTDEIVKVQGLIKVGQSELELLNKRVHQQETSLANVEKSLAELTKVYESKAAAFAKKQQEKANFESLISQVHEHLNLLKQQETSSKEQLNITRQKLEESKISVNQTVSRGNVITSLMKEKKAKRIVGIHVIGLEKVNLGTPW
jgi:structural maintenance of chromosome 4